MEMCSRCCEGIERDREAFYVTEMGEALCRACCMDLEESDTVTVGAGELAPYESKEAA